MSYSYHCLDTEAPGMINYFWRDWPASFPMRARILLRVLEPGSITDNNLGNIQMYPTGTVH